MSPKNKIAGAFEDKVKNDSEFSENEDFKLGAGGTATTGYHMNKKNANAKIRDMIDSETKNNEKQILNLLSTLLSLDILKKQDLTPEEQDCKDVLLNRDIQSKLGIFGSNYLNNFVNLQSCSSTPIKPSNSLKEKQRLLEILNKIIILIHPQVLSETINPLIIARQLRSFLNSSNGYHPSKMSFHSNSLADRVVEQKYIYLCMKVIKNILKKTKNRDIDFCVPMIIEGILKNIETVIGQGNNEEEKEKSSLPSIDYITSQISSRPSQAPSLMNAQRFGNRRNFDGMRDPFSDFSDSRVNPLAAKLKEFNDTKLKLKKKVLPFIIHVWIN